MDTDPVTPPAAQPPPATPIESLQNSMAAIPPAAVASPAMLAAPIAPPPAPAERTTPHSGMGIASLILAVVIGLAVFVVFAIAGFLHSQGRGPHDPAVALVGIAIMGLLAGDVVALGLGIAALCQRNRKKVTAILGVVFSSLILLGTVGLILLGIVMGRHV